MSNTPFSIGATNREHVFSLYAVFGGDATRTAAALNVRVEDIEQAATAGNWDSKLGAIITLRKSAAPLDIERAINRALTFVQGHRLRAQIDRVISRLEGMNAEQLDEYVLPSEICKKTGQILQKISTRPLADLATAAEKAAAICASALADTAADRGRRDEEKSEGQSSGQIHAAIAKAMSEIAADRTPAALLIEAQDATAEALVEKIDDDKKPG